MAALVFDKKDAVNIMMKHQQQQQQQHQKSSSASTTASTIQQQQTAHLQHHLLVAASSQHPTITNLKTTLNNNNNKIQPKNSSMSSGVLIAAAATAGTNPIDNNNRQNSLMKTVPTTGVNNCLSNYKTYISEASKKKIADIIADIEKFNDIEKLYLYLQLPEGGSSHTNNQNEDEGKKKTMNSPFGKKADAEVIQTYAWIQSHLEEDISVSIPKHEVYQEYQQFCEANKFEKLCVADFGKAMKFIFPHVKPRRLGHRGNSKYCYSGLRKKLVLSVPELPIMDCMNNGDHNNGSFHDSTTNKNQYSTTSESTNNSNDNHKIQYNNNKKQLSYDIVWNVILDWVEKKFQRRFKTSVDFARFLIETENIKTTTELANSLNNADKSKPIHNNISKSSIQKKENNSLSQKKKSETNQCNKNGSNAIKLEVAENNDTVLPTSSKTVKILLSSNQQPQQQPTVVNNLPTSATITSYPTMDSSTQQQLKLYKPIQPKQSMLNLVAVGTTTAGTGFNLTNNSSSLTIKKELDEESQAATNNNENDKNYKRQMTDNDRQDCFNNYTMTNKKRCHNQQQLIVTNNQSQQKIMSATNNNNDTCDLKVNELETEALNEYLGNNNNAINNNNNSNDNSDNFVQIRKLLEHHLPNPSKNNNSNNNSFYNNSTQPNLQQNNSNRHSFLPKLTQTNSNSTLQNLLSNLDAKDNQVNGNNGKGLNNKINKNQIIANTTSINNNSPNNRRLNATMFSFQPITANTTSPHDTPTIPEHSPLDIVYQQQQKMSSSIPQKQMASVSVGPSQPSSEANSPFVSPRNTPISFGARSRNNSGQSAYSGYQPQQHRQTPLQSFDSGVSSISSSPFISPQSTPIPTNGMSRIGGQRPINENLINLNRNTNNTTVRVRHSSGPGGPVGNRSQMSHGLMAYNRSNSLSPMMIINENNQCFNNNNTYSSQLQLFENNTKMSVVTQTDQHLLLQQNNTNTKDQFFNFGGQIVDHRQQPKSSVRQRHFSNPYGGVSTQTMNKNDINITASATLDNNADHLKMLLNRSQSVPLHQMFESNTFDSSTLMAMNNGCTTTATNQLQDGSGLIYNQQHGISKSYPATPLCTDDTFNGSSSTNQLSAINDLSLDDLLNNSDNPDVNDVGNVIQSGQDLIVASVHLDQPPTNNTDSNHQTPNVAIGDGSGIDGSTLMLKDDANHQHDVNVSTGFNDLSIINDSDVVEQTDCLLQSLNDAFPDCDNDFSAIDLDDDNNVSAAVYDGDFSV